MSSLDGSAWPRYAAPGRPGVLVVPLGSTEQHGPHLPFTVDTEIAAALAGALERRRRGVVLAPAVPYGSSGEHAGFPGTLSIGRAALELLLVELVRSADAFDGVVLISGHGGNAVPLRAAVSLLRGEGRKVLAWAPSGDPRDSHAGRLETSVMLALRPEAVRTDAYEPGDRRPLARILPDLIAGGVRAVSANGVLGDPRGASSGEGERILARWTAALLTAFDAWHGEGRSGGA
ncbi:mycofactocin biosynthesis peptidyl-dipeptidase MftE [Streptomyces sp. NPDC001194]|uniref:mycofactocin biosynthesis peptidyl-dipeptidase MftE n=1 Tax=Streptomyces sp. NPDC001194 TaxID=3364547 RepID=UPI0036AD9649